MELAMGLSWASPASCSLLTSSSRLYCLLLVAAYLVSTVRWLTVTDDLHFSQAEVSGLLLYLLLGSCTFLLYLLLYLSRLPSSHSSATSHGSAFLRNGALVFGLGSLVFFLLSFAELVSRPQCSEPVRKANSFLAVVFVFLQMVTVIFLPRLNLGVGWGGPHLGLMHLVATNMVLWIRGVLQESLHEYHEKQEEGSESEGGAEAGGREVGAGGRERRATLHPHGAVCGVDDSLLHTVLRTLEPVLFAFTIEFVLIGATVFYNTWAAVGSPAEGGQEDRLVRRPHVRETVQKIDWSNSLWGLVLGLLVFLLNVASLVIFFSIASKDSAADEYAEKVIHSLTNCYGIGAVLLGLRSIQRLVEKEEQESLAMDRFLLNLGVFFVMVYTCFTITVGVFPREVSAGGLARELHIVAGVLNILQVLGQVAFIELLLTKRIHPGEKDHPGRQTVTLLILLNLGLWLVDTFALQKSRASVAEEEYYGTIPWLAVQRITLPICVFFRFHSAVLLTDCWKGSYRPEVARQPGVAWQPGGQGKE